MGGFPFHSPEYPEAEGFCPTVTMYAVIPPLYAVLRLNKGERYRHGSSEINKIALEFHACAVKVLEFGGSLERRS